jgi:anti-sigma factor RsiW
MLRCDDLERLVEEFADGTLEPTREHVAHLAECDLCRERLETARAIHSLLATRELPLPPASFTSNVMRRIQRERWASEQAVDFGFNLAIAAGVLLVVGGALGLAWSFGLLTFGVDMRGLVAGAATQWMDRALQQVQTFLVATILLMTTLGLWWWAEAES